MSSAEKELQKTQRIDSAHVLWFLRSVQRINILSIPQLWVRRLRPFYSEKQIVQAVRRGTRMKKSQFSSPREVFGLVLPLLLL